MLLLEGVTAKAAGRRVLDGLDLAVRRGERFGVVCDDQAALRTIVELLAGHRRPLRGRVRVDGLDPVRDAELLAGRVVVEVVPSTGAIRPARRPRRPAHDARGADVQLVLDARPDDRDGEALVATIDRHQLAPHRTVLLATPDPALATAVCDRTVVLSDGRASAPVLVPIPTPQADHHLEGDTS